MNVTDSKENSKKLTESYRCVCLVERRGIIKDETVNKSPDFFPYAQALAHTCSNQTIPILQHMLDVSSLTEQPVGFITVFS